jgi:hypothetical protein
MAGQMYHKCSICDPSINDCFIIVMNKVPLQVMHTMQHAKEMIRKLSNTDYPRYSNSWEYTILSVKEVEVFHPVRQ